MGTESTSVGAAGAGRGRSAQLQALLEQRQRRARAAAEPVEERIPRRDGTGPAPLAFAQENYWFRERLGPGNPAWVINAPLAWEGPLDLPAMEAAVGEVVRRHEVLRTTFHEADGVPVQRAEPPRPFRLPVVDLGALPADEGEAVRALRSLARGRFDIERRSPWRFAVLRRGAEHALALSVHHLIADGIGLRLFYGELVALYEAARAGRPSPLPELPVQFADYAAWQRRTLAGERLERQVAYWRGHLAEAPELTELPTDRPRPPVLSGRGAHEVLRPRPDLLEGARELARRERVTPFMVLLAAFAALLGRYGRQHDLTVGTPVAGRLRPELERLIGMFINTLVMRVRVGGDPTFTELVLAVRDVALEAYDHQEVPFERLLEELKPQRSLSHSPLFQAFFVLHGAPLVAPAERDWSVRTLGLDPGTAHFELSLSLTEAPAGLMGRLEYSRDLFDPATGRRLLSHYLGLLADGLAHPERRLSALDHLSPAERHQALAEWNDSAVAGRPAASLWELVAAQIARTPEAVAVAFEEERLTYRDLGLGAARLAAALRRHGVGPESLVGVCAERSLEMVVGLVAVLAAGGAYVPLDPGYPAERLAYMLADSGVPVLLTQERLAAGLPEHGARVLLLDRPETWELVKNSLSREEGQARTERNCLSPKGEFEHRPQPAPPSLRIFHQPGDVDPDHPAYAIYTSGSTGRPKGAVNSHRAIVNRLLWMQEAYGLDTSDRVLQKTPFSFDVSVWEFFWPLIIGARLVVARPGGHQDPAYLVRTIAEEAITTLHFVPSMLVIFLEEPGLERLASVRRVIASGEALPPELVARFDERLPPGAELHNLYGPTEAAVDVTAWTCARGAARRTVPIGRPIANVAIHLVDTRFEPAAINVPGELLIGGVALARGYHGRPALTAERFVPDPFGPPGSRLYRTGDLARRLPSGEVEYLGRLDHQVKIRGVRIELAEIEAALRALPGVAEAVVDVRDVRGVRSESNDRRLVAWVVPTAGEADAAAFAARARRELRASLPEHMVPAAWVSLPALPLSPNGKLDRRRLPDPERPAGAGGGGGAPPGTALERTLAAIWAEVLGLPAVSVEDNFFDLGGHSLLLPRVQRLMRERLGRDLPLVELFRLPSVATLAVALAPAAEPTPTPVAAARPAAAGEAVAIVGMAGRFPGAASVDELWERLREGAELIRAFSDDELRASGIPDELLADPRYVRARGLLDGADLFDAAFFDLTPREAEILDPQQRVFLECAWHALEDAGVDPRRFPGRVGVFAGSSESLYAIRLAADRELVRALGYYQIAIATKTDFLPMRASYKLGLTGPSVNVQTTCSTSLVAVHLACRSLVAGECDLALAGGVSVTATRPAGYLHEPGGVTSPDGRCRAFDASAAGIIFGNGVGVVALKRLADALADGDHVEAVILGTAINNDGARKVGLTAPSVEGQERAIAAAHAAAGVHPSSIGYVEAHGTGTRLGDPIEIAALTRAFRGGGDERYCGCLIGSVKTNLGHLDAAAGVTGLIKAALVAKHGEVPPSLHFERPNPEIDFDGSPFRVAARLSPWPAGEGPRRAAVSSFGFGGTNAHAVVEQPPAPPPAAPAGPWHLLLVSARTPTALEAATAGLAAHLERGTGAAPEELADVAFTLQTGRRGWPHRRMLLARDRDDAVAALSAVDPERVVTRHAPPGSRRVAFLFPGQGAQRPGMGAELYRGEPVYREALDRCAELLAPELGLDLREVLHAPPAADGATGEARLMDTAVAQPALLAVEHSLAQLWISWGVRPEAMIGHSVGELTAACLAGVLSLEDALRVVAARGRLVGALPRGGMLAAALSEAEAVALLGPDLSLAAVNGPAAVTVSGPEAAVEGLALELAARGVEHRRLLTSHAFHSAMVAPAAAAFAELMRGVALAPPRIPYVSNVTGTWIRDDEATDPVYYARHLLSTVRFGDSLAALCAEPARVLLEVGPGRTLSALAARSPARAPEQPAIASLATAAERESLLGAAGRLWLAGLDLDWAALHGGPRRRVRLPGYPFERRRYLIERREISPGTPAAAPTAVVAEPEPPPPVVEASAAPPGWVAPRDEVERRVAGIWRELLGVERIGAHDDFFELGGSSLVGVRLGSSLRRAFGVELDPHALLAAPTVAGLARLLRERAAAAETPLAAPALPSILLPLRREGSRPPLVLVHPAGGHVFAFRALAERLGPEQPVWAIRSPGIEPGEEPLPTIEAIAERYLAAVRELQPRGPWRLGGSSMGGAVAYEMAQRLVAAGEEVALLALLDTPAPADVAAPAIPPVPPRPAADDAAPADTGLEAEERQRLARVMATNAAALAAYVPRPYPGRLVFCRARDRRPGEPARPEQLWIDLAEGGAEIHVVPGDHESMHEPPHVDVLARRLGRALTSA